MYRRQTTHHGMVADENVPGQRPVVRENYRVAYLAIMPNMTVSKEVPPIPNPGLACACGASIDCNELPMSAFRCLSTS